MTLRNLTGHTLNIPALGLVLQPDLQVAKVKTSNKLLYTITNGIPVFEIIYEELNGIPEAEPDVLLVVSAPVLNAVEHLMPHRKDIVATYMPTKDPISGRTIGCSALRTNG